LRPPYILIRFSWPPYKDSPFLPTVFIGIAVRAIPLKRLKGEIAFLTGGVKSPCPGGTENPCFCLRGVKNDFFVRGSQ